MEIHFFKLTFLATKQTTPKRHVNAIYETQTTPRKKSSYTDTPEREEI